MNAVDTNVLVYAHDPRDPVKQDKAIALPKVDDDFRKTCRRPNRGQVRRTLLSEQKHEVFGPR